MTINIQSSDCPSLPFILGGANIIFTFLLHYTTHFKRFVHDGMYVVGDER